MEMVPCAWVQEEQRREACQVGGVCTGQGLKRGVQAA